ncbi:hypothetical protein Ancab_037806 [Ancistrocladus abbreviatus]
MKNGRPWSIRRRRSGSLPSAHCSGTSALLGRTVKRRKRKKRTPYSLSLPQSHVISVPRFPPIFHNPIAYTISSIYFFHTNLLFLDHHFRRKQGAILSSLLLFPFMIHSVVRLLGHGERKWENLPNLNDHADCEFEQQGLISGVRLIFPGTLVEIA